MIVDHYIKANHQSRVPNRFLWLDSEAHETIEGWTRTQTWRLAVTCLDYRHDNAAPWREPEWRTHTDPAALWAYVDAYTRVKARTVLVAHNLAYDLRITQAFEHLGAMGWGVHRLSVHDRNIGAVLQRDRRSLVLVDSMAWLPMGLARVGGLVGTRKVDLPCFDDPDDQWEARARQDVVIMREAMFDLLRWIETDDLGNWQRTGAGQAWTTWRHKFYTHRVLVHSDQEARDAEVASAYTGRCEAWRHGKLAARQWVEWDMALCYPRITADVRLPVQLRGHRAKVSMKWVRHMYPSHRLLVRATVTTSTPVLPYRDADGVKWPVGTFDGWWWDVELLTAEDEGATVTPHECFDYRSAPALRAWSRWIIGIVEDPPEGLSPVCVAAAKHQARALIGRFGTRYTVWEPWGRAHPDALPIESIRLVDDEVTGRVLSLGEQAWIGTEERYGADTVPGIMAVVMAEARVRLWQCMRAAGLDHLAYVDTDSLIVDREGSRRLEAWLERGSGWGLRVKQDWRHITVLGPRQLVTDGVGRVAGVPTSAQRFDAVTWTGEKWEGLLAALAHGHTDRVVIRPASWKVRGVDRRRTHLAGGRTAELTVGEEATETRLGASGGG